MLVARVVSPETTGNWAVEDRPLIQPDGRGPPFPSYMIYPTGVVVGDLTVKMYAPGPFERSDASNS